MAVAVAMAGAGAVAVAGVVAVAVAVAVVNFLLFKKVFSDVKLCNRADVFSGCFCRLS